MDKRQQLIDWIRLQRRSGILRSCKHYLDIHGIAALATRSARRLEQFFRSKSDLQLTLHHTLLGAVEGFARGESREAVEKVLKAVRETFGTRLPIHWGANVQCSGFEQIGYEPMAVALHAAYVPLGRAADGVSYDGDIEQFHNSDLDRAISTAEYGVWNAYFHFARKAGLESEDVVAAWTNDVVRLLSCDSTNGIDPSECGPMGPLWHQ